jgi:hypothetical protein
MKKYLFVNKGYFKIIELENNSCANNWAINHLDLSLNPFIFEVTFEERYNFGLKGSDLFSLNAKKFFPFIGSGHGSLIFKKQLL